MTATGTITQSLDSELTSQMTPNSPNAVANHPRRDPPVPPIGAASGVSGGAPFDPGYPSSIIPFITRRTGLICLLVRHEPRQPRQPRGLIRQRGIDVPLFRAALVEHEVFSHLRRAPEAHQRRLEPLAHRVRGERAAQRIELANARPLADLREAPVGRLFHEHPGL